MSLIGLFILYDWDSGVRGTSEDDSWCCSQKNWCFGSPVETALVLVFAAAEPVETHVHGIGTFWDDSVIYDTGSGVVVS